MSQDSDEQLIIKSDLSHTVSLSEGSTNAMGKKSEVGEPSIRKVLADPDEHPVEHVVMGDGVSQSPEKLVDNVVQGDNFKGYQAVAGAPDRFMAVTKEALVPPLRNTVEITKRETHLEVPQDISAAVDTFESDELKEELLVRARAAKQSAMPEMNFPARVINLKIQNDKLRTRLDNLESQE